MTFNPNNPALAEGCIAPKLNGKTLPQIQNLLAQAGCLLGQATTRRSHTVPKHHEISQSPRPGAQSRSGIVNVVLSTGR